MAKRICLEACNLPGDVGAKKGAHLSVSPNQWQDARTNIFLELEVNQKAPNTPSLFVCQIPPVSRSLASAIWRTGSPRALPLCPPGFELHIPAPVPPHSPRGLCCILGYSARTSVQRGQRDFSHLISQTTPTTLNITSTEHRAHSEYPSSTFHTCRSHGR